MILISNTQDVVVARPLCLQMVVAFCGTMTAKEWIQDLTIVMEQLDGEPQKEGLARFFNQKVIQAHLACFLDSYDCVKKNTGFPRGVFDVFLLSLLVEEGIAKIIAGRSPISFGLSRRLDSFR